MTKGDTLFFVYNKKFKLIYKDEMLKSTMAQSLEFWYDLLLTILIFKKK